MSPARKYALLAVGSPSFGALLKYELITGLCQGLPGALGLVARQKLYPFLLGALGRGSTIGRNVTLRGAPRIIIGRNVHIEDGCTLDARGTEACIKIHDNVMVSRNSILRARDGSRAFWARRAVKSSGPMRPRPHPGLPRRARARPRGRPLRTPQARSSFLSPNRLRASSRISSTAMWPWTPTS